MVPLLVTQPASPQVDRWLHEDPALVIWTFTPVEIVSAIRRLVREGSLAEKLARRAEQRAAELVQACHVVIDVEAAKARATTLLRVHTLRAAAALQLAAALEWAGGVPSGRVLHTYDVGLAKAASREGFEVRPEPD